MSQKLTILVNNTAEVEYDRGRPLRPQQLESLNKMDLKMDQGIHLGEELIPNPDTKQRAHFIASLLLDALRNEQDAAIASYSAYLATRLPDVRQVRMAEKTDGVEIDFNYSEIDADAAPISMPGRMN